MPCYSYEGMIPVVDPTAFVHPTAVLIGDVIVGAGCYVGPGASLRGDFGRIILKPGSNLQDNCTMHSFPGQDAVIEENGHVGHGAVLHGCVVGREALVGMNSVVMDGAEIGEGSFVGAMSFVRAGMIVPPKTLVAGVPARIVRELQDKEMAWKLNGTYQYQELAKRSLATMKECDPLPAVEADRPQAKPIVAIPLHKIKAAG
ncbi:MAG TPA: phenylacetic acid degradation protein PaaY [Alphaproteobacteria bacterium]|jgi:phenylacetic acid degradation protein|nr:phenylacetic acid degradation protein PaaY [Alphaproteobacteria bacterium]